MHPRDDSGDVFFKQQCATCIRASIEMIVSFPGAQAIGAFVVQYILDASHISANSAPVEDMVAGGMQHILTPAQLALMAAAANSAPVEDTVAGGMQHDIPQGEQCSLMQPQPLAEAHPFTPTLKEWRRGIKVVQTGHGRTLRRLLHEGRIQLLVPPRRLPCLPTILHTKSRLGSVW